MKLVLATSTVLMVLTCANAANAKVCKGNPTAISYKQLTAGNRSGNFSLTSPDGCQIDCLAGSMKVHRQRSCKWR